METKKVVITKEIEQRINTHWNLYNVMRDPSLTFERIRDVTQKSSVGITRDLNTILNEIYKDDICQPRKNPDKTSQRCIQVKQLLKDINFPASTQEREFEVQQEVLKWMTKINELQMELWTHELEKAKLELGVIYMDCHRFEQSVEDFNI